MKLEVTFYLIFVWWKFYFYFSDYHFIQVDEKLISHIFEQ